MVRQRRRRVGEGRRMMRVRAVVKPRKGSSMTTVTGSVQTAPGVTDQGSPQVTVWVRAHDEFAMPSVILNPVPVDGGIRRTGGAIGPRADGGHSPSRGTSWAARRRAGEGEAVKRSTSPVARMIRRSPTLAKAWWSAAVVAHSDADDASGRPWQCACGPCRAARESGRFNGVGDVAPAVARAKGGE